MFTRSPREDVVNRSEREIYTIMPSLPGWSRSPSLRHTARLALILHDGNVLDDDDDGTERIDKCDDDADGHRG